MDRPTEPKSIPILPASGEVQVPGAFILAVSQEGAPGSRRNVTQCIAERARFRARYGMAGGDHVHFAMQLDGVQIDPKEWWDPHSIKDHIARRVDLPGFSQ